MESLSPSLSLLITVRRHLDQGSSIRVGLQHWLSSESGDFRQFVFRWKAHIDSGLMLERSEWAQLSPWRRSLLELLGRGLQGESVGKALEALELEMLRIADLELQQKLSRLPYLAMIPVLLFQLPAFLLLLFGPLLQNFLHSLGS